jgi:hypothetical protein
MTCLSQAAESAAAMPAGPAPRIKMSQRSVCIVAPFYLHAGPAQGLAGQHPPAVDGDPALLADPMPQNGARGSPLTAWRVVGSPVNASAAATLILPAPSALRHRR